MDNHTEQERQRLKSSIHFKLGSIARMSFRKLNNELITAGIPVLAEQIPILMTLYFHETPITQQEIANLLQKDKSGIQRSIQTLQKEGFLKIESDVVDKRKNMISLTTSGRFLCDKVKGLTLESSEHIRSHFSEEEWNTFLNCLNKIEGIISA